MSKVVPVPLNDHSYLMLPVLAEGQDVPIFNHLITKLLFCQILRVERHSIFQLLRQNQPQHDWSIRCLFRITESCYIQIKSEYSVRLQRITVKLFPRYDPWKLSLVFLSFLSYRVPKVSGSSPYE